MIRAGDDMRDAMIAEAMAGMGIGRSERGEPQRGGGDRDSVELHHASVALGHERLSPRSLLHVTARKRVAIKAAALLVFEQFGPASFEQHKFRNKLVVEASCRTEQNFDVFHGTARARGEYEKAREKVNSFFQIEYESQKS